MIFFTSDTHFGHANIIKYCKRPFTSVHEMNMELIHRWNTVVRKDDIVYHLGDFTLGGRVDAIRYAAQLNGRIHILGNVWHHDHFWLNYSFGDGRHFGVATGMLSASGRDTVVEPPVVVLEDYERGEGEHPLAIVLCHYPFAVWDRSHYGSWHLHGHSHGGCPAEGKRLDVGVDSHDFYPVSVEEVEAYMEGIGT